MIRNFYYGSMLATALSVSLLSVLFLPTVGKAYTPEQQQACTGDAFRLCGSDIPDVDRVTACMIRNKSQLSPGCRAFFRPGPEPVAAAARRQAHGHQAGNVAQIFECQIFECQILEAQVYRCQIFRQ